MTIESTTDDSGEALARAFASGNRTQGMDVLGRCARGWLKAGHVDHLSRWTHALSRTEILAHEAIATTHIASLIFCRRFFEAKQWLDDADRVWSHTSNRSRGRLRTLQLMLAVLADDAGDDLLLTEVGEGPGSTFLSGALIALQAYALLRKQRFDAAKRRALRARDLFAERGDTYGVTYADVLVMLAQRSSGDLLASAQTCERSYAAVEHGPRNPAWVNAAAPLASLRYEQNRLPESRALCEASMPLLRIASTPENFAFLHITLARLELAAGRALEALRVLDHLHSAMEDGRHARLVAMVIFERLRSALELGELELAERIANDAGILDLAVRGAWNAAQSYDVRWDRLGHAYALLLTRTRRVEEATALLLTLIKSSAEAGCVLRVTALEALLASCEWSLGRRHAAFATLNRALHRTRGVGFTRTVFDEAPGVAGVLNAALLEHQLHATLSDRYVERWADVLGCERSNAAPRIATDALTERERHVLTLVAAGLRNEDIAQRLHIAVSTTKWHLKNIFQKLAVECRTQAIARARQLHLLD